MNVHMVVFGVILVLGVVSAKHHKTEPDEDCTEQYKGCRLVNGLCECGVETGCKNPFPYLSEHQCKKDLNGELDKCRKVPCENGQCVQVKTAEGYRSWECSCAGSGFYGRRCQNKCPSLEKEAPVPEGYPSDCVY